MEESGIVLSVENGEATVRFERSEACKKCGACQLGQGEEMLLRVSNTLGAKTGDRIRVALPEGRVLAASLLAYGLPLAGLLLGLFVGALIAPYLPLNPDAVSVGLGALLTIAAFIVNRVLEPARARKNTYKPIPISIENEGRGET